jgi:tRNA(adenine34) deaminase
MFLSYTDLMALALVQAHKAAAFNEVPVGAVLLGPDGAILAQTHNLVEAQKSPLAHAEMLAIAEGLAKVGDKYLTGCTLAVTLEPCPMCMAALCHARIGTVVFGAYDPKSGGTVNGPRIATAMHHKPQIIDGIIEKECAALLQSFFAAKR